MRFLFGALVSLICVSTLHAETPSDLDLELAQKSIQIIQNISRYNDQELNRISTTWNKKCSKKSEDQICLITECEVDSLDCRVDHVLLFRGEDQLHDLSGTSALLRAKLDNSEYTTGLTLNQILTNFSSDLGVLKSFEFSPQDEPVTLSFDSKTLKKQWLWKDSHDLISSNEPSKNSRSAAITAYSFHVEASFPYYQDQSLKKTIGIDPLISVTSNPSVALSFSVHNKVHRESFPEGRVIVFSIPKSALRHLCSADTTLEAGTVLDPRNCTDPLNEHTDEQELDIVVYPRPEWIYRAFIKR